MPSPAQIHQLEMQVEEANCDASKADALRELLETMDSKDDGRGAHISRLFQLAETAGLHKYKAWAELFLSAQHYNMEGQARAKELIDSALSVFLPLYDLQGISAVYMCYGRLEWACDLFATALEYYFKAAEIREETGDKSLAEAYFFVGHAYSDTSNHDQSIAYFERALLLYEKAGDKALVARCYNNIGANYYDFDKQKSLEYHTRSLHASEEAEDKRSMSYSYYWMGTLCIDNNDYTMAEDYLQKSREICEEVSNHHILTYANISLGRLRIHLKDYTPAAMHLQKAWEIAKESPDKRWERAILYEWYHLKKDEGDMASALWFYENYTKLDRQVNHMDLAEKVAWVKFRTDIEKKEKQVEMERNLRNIVEEKNRIIENERQKSEALLLNILPPEVADELKAKGTAAAKLFDNVTVLFTDFVTFTKVSERLTPQQLVDELHACFSAFDEIITKYDIEKIKTVGDAYLAVAGLPVANANHAADIVKAAIEIRDFMIKRVRLKGENSFHIRIGVHSGSVVAGIVGVKKFAYDIWGDTVNTAARMEQHGQSGKINVSQTTYELVKDKFSFEYRGEIEAKNKGKLKMYFLN